MAADGLDPQGPIRYIWSMLPLASSSCWASRPSLAVVLLIVGIRPVRATAHLDLFENCDEQDQVSWGGVVAKIIRHRQSSSRLSNTIIFFALAL